MSELWTSLVMELAKYPMNPYTACPCFYSMLHLLSYEPLKYSPLWFPRLYFGILLTHFPHGISKSQCFQICALRIPWSAEVKLTQASTDCLELLCSMMSALWEYQSHSSLPWGLCVFCSFCLGIVLPPGSICHPLLPKEVFPVSFLPLLIMSLDSAFNQQPQLEMLAIWRCKLFKK